MKRKPKRDWGLTGDQAVIVVGIIIVILAILGYLK